MDAHLVGDLIRNLGLGWGAGLLIGLERGYNGRAAGFRTLGLVGLAAAATVTLAQQPVFAGLAPAPLDASRLAQGVMTGIGFLGAGVIFKEGVSVQGLTTAASIWMTSAIGLLFGAGLILPGLLTTVAAFLTLVVFRWIESRIPWRAYGLALFRFESAGAPDQAGLARLLAEGGISASETSYRLTEGGRILEYRTHLQTQRQKGFEELHGRLSATPGLVEYDVSVISK